MSKHEEIKNNVMDIEAISSSDWASINPEYVTRMRKQNRFKTGLDIAKYTASIMRKDMEEQLVLVWLQNRFLQSR